MLTVLCSYMATLLGDGGDLDSMDRSLLDCELSAERLFKIAQSGNEADIVSLDPTKLSLSCEGSLSRLKITSPPPPPPPAPLQPTSPNLVSVSSVPPNPISRNINEPGRIPLSGERTKTESIVKFSADYKTMVLPSSRAESESCRSDRNIPEQGSSEKAPAGEQSFVYLMSTSVWKVSNVEQIIYISIFGPNYRRTSKGEENQILKCWKYAKLLNNSSHCQNFFPPTSLSSGEQWEMCVGSRLWWPLQSVSSLLSLLSSSPPLQYNISIRDFSSENNLTPAGAGLAVWEILVQSLRPITATHLRLKYIILRSWAPLMSYLCKYFCSSQCPPSRHPDQI